MNSKELREAITDIIYSNYNLDPELQTKETMSLLSENCYLKTNPCENCSDKTEDVYGLVCIWWCGKPFVEPIEEIKE